MTTCYDTFQYFGWDDECDPPEPDKRWLTIADNNGDEVAIIVQRKREGVFREDDAARKIADAEMIVNALNKGVQS